MIFAAMALPLVLALLYSWTARLNQFFFFGRSVAAELAEGAEGRAILKSYRLQIWIGAAASAGMAAAIYPRHHSGGAIVGIIAELLVFYFAFARAHRLAGSFELAEKAKPAVEIPLIRQDGNPPSFGALLAPIAFAVLVVAGATAFAAEGVGLISAPGALNEIVAAHGGESLYSFGMGLVCAGVFALVIRRTARSRTPLGRNVLRSSMMATWAGALIMTYSIASALLGANISRGESKLLLHSMVLLAIAVVLGRIIVMRRFVPPAVEYQMDSQWRWGLFYCNRNDPALFVQSRCAAGYTLNYGRVLAWPITAAFLFVFVGLAIATWAK